MWNPDTYLKFSDLRTRPALELASRCGNIGDGLIYDLGCGPGNSTNTLASLFPGARLIGVDNARSMLDRAAVEGPTDATWMEADLNSWTAEEPADLIFSNAAYNWLPDHGHLFPRLLRQLKQSPDNSGKLAIQMPANFDAPSHVLMRQIAADGPFGDRLTKLLHHEIVRPAPEYYDIFAPHTDDIDIWETDYSQILEGEDPVFNWVSGTALVPILSALNEDEQAVFAADYKAALREAYPQRADGKTLFPFKRIFMVVGGPRSS
jgi:trans-aconitate 2-methyltransferase